MSRNRPASTLYLKENLLGFKRHMNLPDLTLHDFLQDASFQHWVYKTNPVEEQKWNAWLETNPDKKIMAQQAALLLTGISVVPTPIPDSRVHESWQRIKHRLAFEANASKDYSPATNKAWVNQWRGWAALVLFCLGGTLLYYITLAPKPQIYQTNYGETATLTLPDSSTVVLNGNTTLRYAASWNSSESREVWLEGEAFFNVLKKPGKGNAKFVVHTPEVNVQVLGTSFNVTNRREKTRIVLNTGKVNLQATGSSKENLTEILKPGEMAELISSEQKFIKRQVNPEVYSSWTHKKLIFQATPLADIVTLLEENYGYQVQIFDRKILSRTITGEVYIDNVNTLLVALSTSFNLKFESKNQRTLCISVPE